MIPHSFHPAALALLLSSSVAVAQPLGGRDRLREISTAFQSLAAAVDPSVVHVVTNGYAPLNSTSPSLLQARRGSGSGVIVDPDGYILTNAHVVGDVRRVQVLVPASAGALKHPSKWLQATVVGTDRETDIAVLKVAGSGFPTLPFGDSDSLKPGQLVFAVGSPFGLQNSVAMGIVSSAARQVTSDDPMVYVQTDASINPGNSGGPLVDADGAIAGINTFILSHSGANDGVGFAVPVNIARNVYQQIRNFGRVRRGQIGIGVESLTPVLAEALRLPVDSGVLLADVAPGSTAEAAGLLVNDIILEADSIPMVDARQLGLLIYRSVGNMITLKIQRGDALLSLRVSVLERPKDLDRILSLASGETNFVPQLGLLAVDLDARVAPLLPVLRKLSGAVVAGIVAHTASHDDMLHAGDVIYSVNGVPIAGLADLKAAVQPLRHAQPAVLHLERQGKLLYVVVEVE